MFNIYKCSIILVSIRVTLEAGPSKTKKVKTQDLFYTEPSHLR